MKTKVVLWSVILVLLLGLAAGGYWRMKRPQVITFSDGCKLILLGVDYGKHHTVPGGKLPPAPAMPATATDSFVRRNDNGTFTTPEDMLVVWLRAKYDDNPNQYRNYLAIYDKAGAACARAIGRNMSSNEQGDEILTFQFYAFPRRESKLYLRAQRETTKGGAVIGNGSQEIADDKFVISNPAVNKSFPKWTPEPMPDKQSDGDLAVTLTKLVSGADMPYKRNRDNPDDALNKGVQVAFRVERSGKTVTNWQPVSVRTTDATGNRTGIDYGVIGGSPVQWNGDEGTLTIGGGLWPDEPAWKLRIRMTQRSDFSADEEWTAQNIPVVLANHQNFNGYTEAVMSRGDNFVLTGIVSVTNSPPPTPCAEADLNGHHIKVFPAALFTNMQQDLPANPMRTLPEFGLMVQIQPVVASYFMLLDETQPPDNAINVSLAKVTDGQGREIQSVSSYLNYTNNASSIYWFNLRDIGGVTNINATIALHKSRFFEFTVKPEKP